MKRNKSLNRKPGDSSKGILIGVLIFGLYLVAKYHFHWASWGDHIPQWLSDVLLLLFVIVFLGLFALAIKKFIYGIKHDGPELTAEELAGIGRKKGN